MSADTQALVEEMEAFAAERGLSPSYIGSVAVNDGKFFNRIKDGKRCWPETAERVRDCMANWDDRRPAAPDRPDAPEVAAE